VVFSFFKKDPKDNKSSGKGAARARSGGAGGGGSRGLGNQMGRPLADPAGKGISKAALPNQRFATTENALPDRELQRSLAMETAAKIDAIESEMARDFLRPSRQNVEGVSVGGPTTGGTAVAVAPPQAAAAVDRDDDSLDANGDGYLGSIDAIELNTSGAGSVIDETAILFANGQHEDAEASLRAAIQADELGHSTQSGWLMLFELVNQRGDKAGFEKLAMDYVLRFENSPPAWTDYGMPGAQKGPAGATAGAVVRLPATIDANIVKPLEQLKALAANHATLTLDMSAARSIDLVGAELLLRVIHAFKRASHELIVQGVEQLVTPLRGAIEAGRRDASDAGWMLLLEVFRLLGRQHDFDETGIQYCITFEVSPPSWEPPPPNVKVRGAAPVAAGATPTTDDPCVWRGVIDGEGEPFFGRLAMEARTNKELKIDCGQLKRMGFSAASALLSLAMKLQQGGASVEFNNVNYLVGALFQLLGITAVASVQLRRT
jgi:anti-anti-sigma regulatory factor